MTALSKSCFALVFAGLLTIGAGAQVPKAAGVAGMESSGAQPNSSTFTVTIPTALSCPISMRAQFGWGGGLVAVRKEDRPHRSGQRIELTLTNSGNTTISAIRIAVHGWEGSPRATPARVVNSNDTNASRTIELKTPIAPHQTITQNLWVNGLNSVESIDLLEVQYARGLSWRASASRACRILPDGEMLIATGVGAK